MGGCSGRVYYHLQDTLGITEGKLDGLNSMARGGRVPKYRLKHVRDLGISLPALFSSYFSSVTFLPFYIHRSLNEHILKGGSCLFQDNNQNT